MRQGAPGAGLAEASRSWRCADCAGEAATAPDGPVQGERKTRREEAGCWADRSEQDSGRQDGLRRAEAGCGEDRSEQEARCGAG